ncbi:MAG: SCO family protein [Actinomycetota bacterium]|nr:SCO family protein [Actinomycetota bacterium]
MITARRTALLAASVLLVAACGSDEKSRTLSGYELDPPPSVAALSLPDVSDGGTEFDFVADDGRLLIVYFGYTSCPDVCPTTLAELKKALKQVGDDASKVDLAMITIDPDRDTDEIVAQYVQSFIPGAHALRTTDEPALEATAAAFGASYSVETTAEGEIEVGHSAAMYVVDSAGDVVLTWPFGIPADGIATDLEILFDRSAS